MLAVFAALRNRAASLSLMFAAVWLAACEPVNVAGGGSGPDVSRGETISVALLVPRSSPQGGAILASSLENAARLAIGDQAGVQIDLRVYDTAGQPGQAAAVADRAVSEGAQIIIGPLFADAAAAAGVAVAGDGVNVLSFSNNPAVAGGNVFILGNTFQSAADRLTQFAVRRGQTNIFIVNGNDAQETLGRDAIARAIARSGAQQVGNATFQLSQQGVTAAAPRIARQIEDSNADAVFFTSGTDGALPFLADLLPGAGVSTADTQFIALRRLDIPSSALSVRGLQGSWFTLPDQSATNRFNARYAAAYGGQPHPLAGLAYDAIVAVGTAARSSGRLGTTALTRGSGFAGAYGAFRLNRDGSNDRALAVAAVRNNQVSVIDPAPRSFGGAGF